MTIRFRVDGEPKGQPRVRAVRRGNHAGVYDPGTANGWKDCVRFAAMPHRPETPLSSPLGVRIVALFSRPGRLLKKKSPTGRIRHIAKPDSDNVFKSTTDALSDIGVWIDDRIICEHRVEKWYVAIGERAGAEVEIEILEEQI